MRILIAEDEDVTRTLLKEQLGKIGYEVLSCENGRTALETLLGKNPPEIAILDWMMPELTGPEICQSVKKNKPDEHSYMILLTSKDGKEDIITGLRAGAQDYMTKPFRYSDLVARLDVAQQYIRLQKLLVSQQAKMLYSSKMASLGEMAGNIAHEVNNPLAIINTGIDLIMAKINQPEFDRADTIKKCEKIKSTIIRITKIISSLKAFASGRSSEDYAPILIKDLIEDALSFSQMYATKNSIELILPILKYDVSIECQRVQICQVLVNLLNNAFFAISDISKKWVEIDLRENDTSVDILVTDCGLGIPQEIQSKIMEPFFTTKQVGKGTGLGLSISKGIVESHGGKIYVDNQSLNTRFVIHLPKKKPEERSNPSPQA